MVLFPVVAHTLPTLTLLRYLHQQIADTVLQNGVMVVNITLARQLPKQGHAPILPHSNVCRGIRYLIVMQAMSQPGERVVAPAVSHGE